LIDFVRPAATTDTATRHAPRQQQQHSHPNPPINHPSTPTSLVENTLRAIPLVGGWIAPAVTGGNRRNLALLRAHVAQQQGVAGVGVGVGVDDGLLGDTKSPARAAAETRRRVRKVAEKGLGLWAAARRVLLGVSWPVRQVPLWLLVVVVVVTPLAVGAGAVGFAVYTGLRWLGVL